MNFTKTSMLEGLRAQRLKGQEQKWISYLSQLSSDKLPTSPAEHDAYIAQQEILDAKREKETQLHLPLVIDLHPHTPNIVLPQVLINQPEHYPALYF